MNKYWTNKHRTVIKKGCHSCRHCAYGLPVDSRICKRDGIREEHKPTFLCERWEPMDRYKLIGSGIGVSGKKITFGDVKTLQYLKYVADNNAIGITSIAEIRANYKKQYPERSMYL